MTWSQNWKLGSRPDWPNEMFKVKVLWKLNSDSNIHPRLDSIDSNTFPGLTLEESPSKAGYLLHARSNSYPKWALIGQTRVRGKNTFCDNGFELIGPKKSCFSKVKLYALLKEGKIYFSSIQNQNY